MDIGNRLWAGFEAISEILEQRLVLRESKGKVATVKPALARLKRELSFYRTSMANSSQNLLSAVASLKGSGLGFRVSGPWPAQLASARQRASAHA